MKPKPLSGLNHFTVPCAICCLLQDELWIRTVARITRVGRISCWLPAIRGKNPQLDGKTPDVEMRAPSRSQTSTTTSLPQYLAAASVFPYLLPSGYPGPWENPGPRTLSADGARRDRRTWRPRGCRRSGDGS